MIDNQEKTLVIELNEFNHELLTKAASDLNLSNIKRILSFTKGVTLADHHEEHQGLDPWVQWVSIHSESPSQVHKIIRLGDISKLTLSQIWERLGRKDITTGVWGVMNGSSKNSPNNKFFFSDPWTFTETATPQELNNFLALPVYYAKNYMDLSILKILQNFFKTGWFIFRNVKLTVLLSDAFFLLKNALKMKKIGTSFLFCAYELISTRIFATYKDKYNPIVNFIFINSIAHFQHHDWHETNKFDVTSKFVFSCIDRIISIILPLNDLSERILVLSALSQHNVSNDHIYCYRQISPTGFLNTLGLKYERVEQCMTNEAHVFFFTESECNRAINLLENAKIGEKPAFFVEKDDNNPKKMFYQFIIWDKLDDSSLLKCGNITINFFDEFAIYAKRTGAHIPTGFYLTNKINFPEIVNNSDIFSHVWESN